MAYYEQAGDYGRALENAHSDFSETVARLEEKLLSLGFSTLLFDENYQPRVKLLQLLDTAGMEPLDPLQDSLLQINRWAQKNLLRQGERWEEQTNRFEALKPLIKPLLDELGFVKGVLPHFQEYQGAVLQAGFLPRVRLRLQYLIEQWDQGVRFSHLYFLSGERPLEAQEKDMLQEWSSSLLLPKTEREMVQCIWEQSPLPEELRNQVEVHFINAPMKKDPLSEKLLRPNAEDTVETWLKTSPPHGLYLTITNAPYIHRQNLVLRSIAPSEYTFDTVGPASSEHEKMAIFLDELARSIFQKTVCRPVW